MTRSTAPVLPVLVLGFFGTPSWGQTRPALTRAFDTLAKAGSVLDLIETVPLENTGQGIAWDRSAPGILYAIQRPSGQAVVSRMLR